MLRAPTERPTLRTEGETSGMRPSRQALICGPNVTWHALVRPLAVRRERPISPRRAVPNRATHPMVRWRGRVPGTDRIVGQDCMILARVTATW
eukprot:3654137-Prymnesium_polylepis.1